jgi:hypothetical protein
MSYEENNRYQTVIVASFFRAFAANNGCLDPRFMILEEAHGNPISQMSI